MKKILLVTIILVSLPETQLFAQSFSTKEWDIISKGILDQNAENKMLKQNAVADSITISLLQKAHVDSDSVISKLYYDKNLLTKKLTVKDSEIKVKIKENSDCELDRRKQKILKWVFIIAIPIAFEEGYRLHR